jgi:CRISPR-associated Csx3 family protein
MSLALTGPVSGSRLVAGEPVAPATFNGPSTDFTPINLRAKQTTYGLRLKMDLPEDYLVYEPELTLPLPPFPPSPEQGPGEGGVILDGKLPNWLYTGLTLFYRSAPWVAIYYPHLNQAIIVASQQIAGQYSVGQSLPLRDDLTSTLAPDCS